MKIRIRIGTQESLTLAGTDQTPVAEFSKHEHILTKFVLRCVSGLQGNPRSVAFISGLRTRCGSAPSKFGKVTDKCLSIFQGAGRLSVCF